MGGAKVWAPSAQASSSATGAGPAPRITGFTRCISALTASAIQNPRSEIDESARAARAETHIRAHTHTTNANARLPHGDSPLLSPPHLSNRTRLSSNTQTWPESLSPGRCSDAGWLTLMCSLCRHGERLTTCSPRRNTALPRARLRPWRGARAPRRPRPRVPRAPWGWRARRARSRPRRGGRRRR